MTDIDVTHARPDGPRYGGPPPCQVPDCGGDSHFRTGYVYCLDHDSVDVPKWDAEPVPSGIATDDFRFFFGASCGSSRKTLRQLEEPNVMLSYATRTNTPWEHIQTLMVDSGGYSLLSKGEVEYPDSVDDYLDYVERVGSSYFVTRDMPAAPAILEKLDRGVSTAIATTVDLTVETLERWRNRGLNRWVDTGESDPQPMAVLQGTTPDEYVQCYHELVARGALTGRLAIGSLKPHSPSERVDIITAVREQINADTRTGERIELHALGIGPTELAIPEVRRALASADSSLYIRTARWRGAHGEQPPRLRDDEPRSGWYEVLRSYLEMRANLRDVLDDGAEYVEVMSGGEPVMVTPGDEIRSGERGDRVATDGSGGA